MPPSAFQCLTDPGVGAGTLSLNALGVHTQEYVNAMPGTLGDLGGRDTRIKPQRHRSVS